VVRRVARRVDGPEGELGPFDGVAVHQVPVAHQAVPVVEGQDLGTGALLEPRCTGRVVRVGVGAEDPADAVATRGRYGIEVGFVGGAGVDHCDLVYADHVAVGAGSGHDARVA